MDTLILTPFCEREVFCKEMIFSVVSNNAISDYNLILVALKQTYGMAFGLAASSLPWVFLSFSLMFRYLIEQAQVFNKA